MIKKTSKKSNCKVSNNKKLSNPNLIIKIKHLKCLVDVNEDVYSLHEKEKLTKIIKNMSKDIWIDRTYVCYKGSRWKYAFLSEDAWNDFCRIVVKTDFGKKYSKRDEKKILDYLMFVSLIYLMYVAVKYGYDADNINISIKQGSKFKASYEIDNRTSWNF